MSLSQEMRRALERGDYQKLIDAVPYARTLGMGSETFGDEVVSGCPATKTTSVIPFCRRFTVG